MMSRCPYLGLHTDRTITFNTPTTEHCCYVGAESFCPDESYQQGYCLCNNYLSCARFVPLPAAALISMPTANLSVGNLPLVQVQKTPQVHRVLLPKRAVGSERLSTRREEVRLLPLAPSPSAAKIHRWSFLSTQVSLLATTVLLLLTFSLGLFWHSYRVLPLGRDYRITGVVALPTSGAGAAAATSMPVTIIALGDKQTETPTAILFGAIAPGESVQQRSQPVYALKPPPTPTPEPKSTQNLETPPVVASTANLQVKEEVIYITATPTPANGATATAQVVIATAYVQVYGTQTPLPANVMIVTATPVEGLALPTATAEGEFIVTPVLTSTAALTLETIPLTATQSTAQPALTLEALHNKIVFKSNRDGEENVYTLDPTTNAVAKIDRPELYSLAYQQLARAPDGRTIAVVGRDANNVLQIQIESQTDNQVKALTTFAGDSYDPAWSPQGDRIAFVSANSGDDEIYVITADGLFTQQLTFNGNRWDKHPTWSPDGSQIVFYANQAGTRRQLWIMQADGSDPRNLSNNEYDDWDPIWVP